MDNKGIYGKMKKKRRQKEKMEKVEEGHSTDSVICSGPNRAL